MHTYSGEAHKFNAISGCHCRIEEGVCVCVGGGGGGGEYKALSCLTFERKHCKKCCSKSKLKATKWVANSC